MDSRAKLQALLHQTLHTDQDQVVDELVRESSFVRAEKGTKLFREGEQIRDCYLLMSGVVRAFFVTADGEELTEWFNFRPGDIIHPSYRMLDENTAKASVEAATECELAHIPMASLMEVVRLHPEFDQIRVRVLQTTLERQAVLKRSLVYKSPSARYEWLMENWPELVGTVPQKHIASFLCMTPVSLSRIRSRYKKKLSADD